MKAKQKEKIQLRRRMKENIGNKGRAKGKKIQLLSLIKKNPTMRAGKRKNEYKSQAKEKNPKMMTGKRNSTMKTGKENPTIKSSKRKKNSKRGKYSYERR